MKSQKKIFAKDLTIFACLTLGATLAFTGCARKDASNKKSITITVK
jgi:hypothetical protein